MITNVGSRAGGRAVGFGGGGGRRFSEGVGKRFSDGGQSLKLSTKAAVFKRVSLLIAGGAKHVSWGSQAPLGADLNLTEERFRLRVKSPPI